MGLRKVFNQLLSSTESAVDIGRSSGSLIFCIVLAGFVWFSTKAVDRFSVVLIAGMVIFPLYNQSGRIR